MRRHTFASGERTAHRITLVWSIIAALYFGGVAGAAEKPTKQQVEDAIEYGRTNAPTGYPLRSAFPKSSYTPGIVLTPLVRVALAARFAFDSGRPFGFADVPPEMLAPLLYFVFRDEASSPLQGDAQPRMRLVTEHSRPGSTTRKIIPATWVSADPPQWLRHHLNPAEKYVLGAFPVVSIQADTRVELYRVSEKASGGAIISTVPALISAADLAHWK